ncbi:MAG: superoxide dismutase [Spirochaetales bacterium]|nr:superoxide dismutase [Spirochaetales bacterium]NLX45160.1 superoxide dismutase [Treponema sp.]
MSFTVPVLQYAFDALEPHIDAETMAIHHDKHHAAYVSNLNKAIEGTEYAVWSLEALVRDWDKLPAAIKTAVRNNGGGHYNHSFLWESIAPNSGGRPAGALATAIEKDLGGFDAFKTEFEKAALNRFGSGWAWLSYDGKCKKLVVGSTANQDSPLSEGLIPLLGVDVWEHAYYLKYQNRRADYLKAFFNVIDWRKVAERFEKALS